MKKLPSSKAAATSIASIATRLHELLHPLTPEERSRLVQATFVLFGEQAPFPTQPGTPLAGRSGSVHVPVAKPTATNLSAAHAYFLAKQPKNKGENFAVAARFREDNNLGESHTKDHLKAVIKAARHNFDDANFMLDIKNAKNQAGLFNTGTDREQYTLSYYGQQYVDLLPDRKAASKLKRPKGRNKKLKSKKSKT